MKARWSLCSALLLAGAVAWGCSGDDPATGSGGAGASSAAGGFGGSGATAGAGGATGGGGGNAGATGGAGGSTGGSGGNTHGLGGSGGSTGGAGGSSASLPDVGGCTVFTADDEWNRDISQDAVDTTWTQNLMDLVGAVQLHPDFGNWGSEQYGIPINVVPQNQAPLPVAFDWSASESDPGPYPFPPPGQALIEGGTATDCNGDCHLIAVQQGACMLYEGYACSYTDQWHCGSGAKWDLTKNSYGQRPDGWTSADAAGLPIMPGLLRYDEVASGAVHHAVRFTTHCTRSKYVKPATHFAVPGGCSDSPTDPPMGLRVRLKQGFDISGFGATAQVILTALQHYGMILADNGSDFYFQGEANAAWNSDLDELKAVPANAFEVIAVPPLQP